MNEEGENLIGEEEKKTDAPNPSGIMGNSASDPEAEVESPPKKNLSCNKFCIEISAKLPRMPEFVLEKIKLHIKSGVFRVGWLPVKIQPGTKEKAIIFSQSKTKNIGAKKKFKDSFFNISLKELKIKELEKFLGKGSFNFFCAFSDPILFPKAIDEFQDLTKSLYRKFTANSSTILDKVKEHRLGKDLPAFLKAIKMTMELNHKIGCLEIENFSVLVDLYLEIKDESTLYKSFVDNIMADIVSAAQQPLTELSGELPGELPGELLVDGALPQEPSASTALLPAQPFEVSLSQVRADGIPVVRTDFRIVRKAIGPSGFEDFCSYLGIKDDTFKRVKREIEKDERLILTEGKKTPVFTTIAELNNYYENLKIDKKK